MAKKGDLLCCSRYVERSTRVELLCCVTTRVEGGGGESSTLSLNSFNPVLKIKIYLLLLSHNFLSETLVVSGGGGEWVRASTGDRTVAGSSPTSVKTLPCTEKEEEKDENRSKSKKV